MQDADISAGDVVSPGADANDTAQNPKAAAKGSNSRRAGSGRGRGKAAATQQPRPWASQENLWELFQVGLGLCSG